MSRRRILGSFASVVTLLLSLLSVNAAAACDYSRATTVYRTHRVAQPVRYVGYSTVVPVSRTHYKPAAIRRVTVVRKDISVSKTAVRAGATININGDFFGSESGRVFVRLKGVRMDAKIASWSTRRVTVQLPLLSVPDAGVMADLQVFSTTGRLAKDVDVLIKPAIDDIEEIAEVTVAAEASAQVATEIPAVIAPQSNAVGL